MWLGGGREGEEGTKLRDVAARCCVSGRKSALCSSVPGVPPRVFVPRVLPVFKQGWGGRVGVNGDRQAGLHPIHPNVRVIVFYFFIILLLFFYYYCCHFPIFFPLLFLSNTSLCCGRNAALPTRAESPGFCPRITAKAEPPAASTCLHSLLSFPFLSLFFLHFPFCNLRVNRKL